jgi:hypothetical protein
MFYFNPPVAVDDNVEAAIATIPHLELAQGVPSELFIESDAGFAHFEVVRNAEETEVGYRGKIPLESEPAAPAETAPAPPSTPPRPERRAVCPGAPCRPFTIRLKPLVIPPSKRRRLFPVHSS